MNSIYLKRNETILANEVGGEMVMMSIEDGKYFGLNKTGTCIWKLLDKPKSIDEVCKDMCKIYQVSEDKCLTDVLPFIEDLLKENIVVSC